MRFDALRRSLLAHVGLAWPWVVCGLVASLLVAHQRDALIAREHPTRHALEMRARGVRHVRHGQLRARVECEDALCRVTATLRRSPLPSPRWTTVSFGAPQGGWVAVLEHGSSLRVVDEEAAPPFRPGSPASFVLAVVVTVLFGSIFLAWAACAHDDLLWLRGARPCRVVGGAVELLDGDSPARARSMTPAADGRAWARVFGRPPPPGGYRDEALPLATVIEERDGRLLDAAIGRSRALMGLAALGSIWLVTLLAWT